MQRQGRHAAPDQPHGAPTTSRSSVPLCVCPPLLQLLWSFAALMILPVALSMLPVQYSLAKDIPPIPHSHVDVVSGAAAAIAFIGELLMIKAMLVYDDGGDRRMGQGVNGTGAGDKPPSRLQQVGWHEVVGGVISQSKPSSGGGCECRGSSSCVSLRTQWMHSRTHAAWQLCRHTLVLTCVDTPATCSVCARVCVSLVSSCSTGPCWRLRWLLCWACCCPSQASCCSWPWNTCLTCPQGVTRQLCDGVT